MIKHLRLLHGITINECSVFDALRRSRAPVASSTLDSQPSASNSSLETESGWYIKIMIVLFLTD